MKILGIQGSLNNTDDIQHNTSAALVIDGKIVSNYEEERFNRIKYAGTFPRLAIKEILTRNNLTINDIDVIAAPINEDELRKEFPELTNIKIIYHSHHMGHICDSYYQSGFNSAVCLIIDGCGDCNDGITIAHIHNNKIEILKKFSILQSLGLLYSAGVRFCNLGDFAEGKLMGLSAYGKPDKSLSLLYWKNKDIIVNYTDTNIDILNDIFENDSYKLYNYIETKISNYFKENIYPYINNDNYNIMYYTNFAATIQYNYEKVLIELVKYCKELTNEDNLILSGGCIQNCVANDSIIRLNIFKHVYSSPAPHDGGCAAGYALYAAHILGESVENKRVNNSFVGKTYDDKDILRYYFNYNDYNEDILVNDLINNKIIGWFQGGSEIGPRALGHRSILANPNSITMLHRINNIKHRESWRPLAPIVPAELFDLIFDTDNYDLTEFMLRALPIRPEMRRTISAVCHIDGTTRPQRLEKDVNPELYSLLIAFYNKTGIPCLINTSFNDRGQPIIESPQQAIDFLKTHKDMNSIVFNSKYKVERYE